MNLFRSIAIYFYVIGSVFHGVGHYKKLEADMEALGGQDAVDAEFYKFAKKTATRIMKLNGSQVLVRGEENLPKEGPVLYVANHQSYMDIPVMVHLLSHPVGFIAKDNLADIPVFKNWFEYLNCVLIARGDARKALQAILQAAKLLQQGKSLVLFPEGTRSADGKLNEFKAGSLKAAQRGKVAIVPVAIDGARDIMPRGSFLLRKTIVKITVLPPIPAEEAAASDTHELSLRLQSDIARALGQEVTAPAAGDGAHE